MFNLTGSVHNVCMYWNIIWNIIVSKHNVCALISMKINSNFKSNLTSWFWNDSQYAFSCFFFKSHSSLELSKNILLLKLLQINKHSITLRYFILFLRFYILGNSAHRSACLHLHLSLALCSLLVLCKCISLWPLLAIPLGFLLLAINIYPVW